MKRTQHLLQAMFLACTLVTVQKGRGEALAKGVGTAPSTATSAGQKIFGKWCGDCHGTRTGPGSMTLERRYQGSVPAILTQRRDLSPDFVKLVVRHGMSFMPSFRKTEISDADLVLVALYLAPPQGQAHRTAKRGQDK